MHIICCIKQVPDTAQVKIDPETNTLVRSGVESICNPYDLVAVESAVQLTEKYGGKVTIISMGPPQTESSLRECLAIGGSEAILLSDRAFAGADTLATSYTLSKAITRIASIELVDLVICGKQAIDGDTGQTGPGVATRLGYTQFTYVSEVIAVDLENRNIRVKREIEDGSQIVQGTLPAVITVELELCTPRYASLPELVRSLRQNVEVWDLNEIGGSTEQSGLKGSPTWVNKIFSPPARKGGPVYDIKENGQQVINTFLDTIFEEGILRKDELSDSNKG